MGPGPTCPWDTHLTRGLHFLISKKKRTWSYHGFWFVILTQQTDIRLWQCRCFFFFFWERQCRCFSKPLLAIKNYGFVRQNFFPLQYTKKKRTIFPHFHAETRNALSSCFVSPPVQLGNAEPSPNLRSTSSAIDMMVWAIIEAPATSAGWCALQGVAADTNLCAHHRHPLQHIPGEHQMGFE